MFPLRRPESDQATGPLEMRSGVVRPVGLSAGALGLLIGWLGGFAIARLTGATPVVIVLAAGLVLFVAGVISGWWSARQVSLAGVTLPPMSIVGDEIPLEVGVTAPRPVFVEVRVPGEVVASGWTDAGRLTTTATLARRGRLDTLDVRVRSAGSVGLVWWGRRHRVATGGHLVAPRSAPSGVPASRMTTDADGERPGSPGSIAGEIDGIRPWRDGDSEKYVHWSSSIRHGELVVHDRRSDVDQRVVVRARSDRDDPDAEAAGARWALDHALRSGADVYAAVDDGDAVAIVDQHAASRWSALAELGAAPPVSRLSMLRFKRVEPDVSAPIGARRWAAGATLVSLVMLSGALGRGPLATTAIVVAVVLGAAVSSRTIESGEQPSAFVRLLVGIGALGALAVVAASTGRLDGLLAILRGPLPEILVILVLLHGFECHDRRTIRVGLAISGVVLMYAAGFRVDGTIGWWLLAWTICFGMAIHRLSGPTRAAEPLSLSAVGRRGAAISVGAAATVAVLAVVPVPDGPARLTLPTLIEDVRGVDQPGALATPDGDVSTGGDSTQRAPAGQVGGYPGFSNSMDTSVRGELGDEIVMRVRAPGPDFWRGQTFSTFDGRTWHVDEQTGTPRRGPDIEIPPALGDMEVSDEVEVERFVQTYFVETDLPNVLFAASRPSQVIVDADVWTRPDGAIRSSVVLTEGSVYTVVSERAQVTDADLRRQRDIASRLSDLGREVLGPYLQVPESTTERTIMLASELAEGQGTTLDVVRSYEAWLTENVAYDLNAPVPAAGEDAVDDFLFESRRGFCEQIASALTIMLRSQGVPARVATGYIPGTRDRISGVFEVRASDAHAWVEVWFPETGWQAFDPTASVPLAGDSDIESVGADLAAGVGGYVGDHPVLVGAVVFGTMALVGLVRVSRDLLARRRRGRWGVLQDRFGRTASRRGASAGASNPTRAAAWAEDVSAAQAAVVAERLDRVAFDPTFVDDDEWYRETEKLVGELGGGRR